ncbi:ATP-binding cassette domain-containing protein [Dulcicalothrix desertica]|uniref:ATP-binding cassette domain-containing protein n=1 Tax=Dulcicalothrix desertica TaxID=32056 RepID=UPI00119B7BC0|nr:ABC transporter ATP-binding protein [Dulcicalothrix desertica]TWH55422.1 ATP-binding cassette subfamily B protein/ATP-binding cassette subfamily C protein [Dulcicalothrix desertica PCC 7102]
MNQNKKIDIKQLLWRMIRYNFRLYLIDAFFWLFIAGLPIIPGLIIREFLNTLTNQSQFSLSPWTFVILLVATGIGRVIFIFIGRVTKTQHRFTMSALIRHNLLRIILNRPAALALKRENQSQNNLALGELISYFRDDVELIEDNVVSTSELFDAGVFATIAFIILASINWQMTILIFLPVVGIVVFIQQMEHRIKRYRRASRMATENVTGLIGEIFNSVQAIKVAGAETSVINHFQKLNDQRRRTMLKDQLFTAILNSSFQNLVNFGTGIVLLLSANLLKNNIGLTVGDFALFVYYLAYITDFITFFGEFMALTKQTEVSFERMTDLIEDNTNLSNTLVASQPLYLNNIWGERQNLPRIEPIQQTYSDLQTLTVQNLTYLHQGSNQGIKNITFEIQRGTLNVITGDIGAGKTTLLQVLLGLLPLQTGKIYWNGCLINDPAIFFTPPRSAYVPQIPQLFSQTLRDNLLLGRQAPREDIEKALYNSVFAEDIGAMPLGLETLVGYKGVRLSGGQLQRAAITRALIHQPELLVFDDISSALDVQTEEQLWRRLCNTQKQQHTILVVSHREWLINRADQIIVINQQ